MAGELNVIAEKARVLETRRDFQGALKEWENLGRIYPRFPGLSGQLNRLQSSLEKLRAERKLAVIKKIEEALGSGAYNTSAELLKDAENEFPADDQIAALRLARERQLARVRDVEHLLDRAREASKHGRFDETADTLAEAGAVSREFPALRRSVFEEALLQAEAAANSDWRTAKVILDHAAGLDPGLSVPNVSWESIRVRERDENIQKALDDVIEAEKAGELLQAQTDLEHALERYPGEPRLNAKLDSIENAIREKRRKETRDNDLSRLRALHYELGQAETSADIHEFVSRSKMVAEPYGNDREFTSVLRDISEQAATHDSAAASLANDNVRDCIRICNEALARYPDSRLFASLRAQGEARERENAAEFLERVARRLATEPDLPTRAKILEEALREYPNEQYFADELTLVRNEQQIIQTIVERARSLEKSGYVSEALEQWTHLKSLYPNHPDIERAIENCNDILGKKREAARNRLRAAIEKALTDRDYGLAAERLREAKSDFPEEPSLGALEALIAERTDLRSRALGHLKQGESDLQRGDFPSGQEQLLKALRAAENEPDIPKAIAASLIQHAAAALSSDLEVAESMLAQAKAADPSAVLPKGLQSALDETRTRRDAEEFRSAVGLLETSENFAEALRIAQEFLTKYPGNATAASIQKRLLKARDDLDKKQQREQHFLDLRSLEDQAKTVTYVGDFQHLLKRAGHIARQNNTDLELTQAAEQVSRTLSAVARIRKLIHEGRLREAEQACTVAIAESPQSSSFEPWRAEIALRQNERASEYLRRVERELNADPDFTKQEQILEEAVREYPHESYFVDELTLVRNKRSLLEAEIARARDLESKELYEDALREWENLCKAYPWYAGIENELDRVRRVWELRTAAVRDRWLARIRKALGLWDVDLADAILEESSRELAGDPELADLKQGIQNARRSQEARQNLLLQGSAALERGEFSNAVALLGRAATLIPEDIGFRDSVINLLLKKAESISEIDWQGADILIDQIAKLHPGYSVPVKLKQALDGKRRDREIAVLLDQVGQVEQAGNLQEAQRLLDAASKRFPAEERVTQRLSAVHDQVRQLALREAREEARRQTEEARSRIQGRNTSRQLAKARSAYLKKGFADSADPEIKHTATELITEIDSKLSVLVSPNPTHQALRRLWYVPVVLALAAGLLALRLLHKSNKTVQITTIEGSKAPLSIASPPVIQIADNAGAGDVYLDDKKVGALKAGSLELRQLSPGVHILRVSSPEGDATIPVFNDPGTGARVSAPIKTRNVSVVAVSTSNQAVTLTTSAVDAQPVSVDDRSAGSTAKGSLILPTLPPGNHRLQIGPPKEGLNFDLMVQPKPSMSLLITGEALTGWLTVRTNVPGAEVI